MFLNRNSTGILWQRKMFAVQFTSSVFYLTGGFILLCAQYGECAFVEKDMRNQNLSSVPFIETGLNIIILNNNLIKEIGPTGVAPATDLIDISLNYNLIRVIDDNAFVSCTKLRRVELENNELLPLPSKFGLNILTHLHVSQNKNLIMPQSYFSRFEQLEDLDIGYTSVILHNWKGLEKLRHLTIDGSNYFPNLNGHPKLRVVWARHLKLTHIPNSYISNLPQLQVLGFNNGMFQSSPVPSNVSFYFMLLLVGNGMMTNIEDMTHITGEIVAIDAIGCPLHCRPGLCWMILEQYPNIQFRASCATPNEFNGTDPSTLPPLDLQCYEGKHLYMF